MMNFEPRAKRKKRNNIIYIFYSYSKLLELSVCDADVLESEKKKDGHAFSLALWDPIIIFFDGRAPSRHKQNFFI